MINFSNTFVTDITVSLTSNVKRNTQSLSCSAYVINMPTKLLSKYKANY